MSVIMALIVNVNHCDRFRDGDRVFVCMTVIVIVTDRFLIYFLFIVFVFQPVLYL